MNINVEAYSKMLKYQADICFPFEATFFYSLGIEGAENIVEIGSGNGYYLNKLSKFFCRPNYFGFDINEDLVSESKKYQNITFEVGTNDRVEKKHNIIILRLLLHHLQNPVTFVSSIYEKMGPETTLVIIDAYDSMFCLVPEMKSFMSHLEKHRKKLSHGNATRNIEEVLSKVIQKTELEVIKEQSYYVSSLVEGYKNIFYNYMYHTADMTGIDNDVKNDLDDWLNSDNSFAQFGLKLYGLRKS